MDEYYKNLQKEYNKQSQDFMSGAQQQFNQQTQQAQQLNQQYQNAVGGQTIKRDEYTIPTGPDGYTGTTPGGGYTLPDGTLGGGNTGGSTLGPDTGTTTPTTTPGGTVLGPDGSGTGQTNPTTPQGLTTQDYINYYIAQGKTTPDMDYDSWVAMMQGGSNPGSNPGSSTTPTSGGDTTGDNTGIPGGTQSAEDIIAEWNALIAKYQAGTLTIEEAHKLEELAGLVPSVTTGTPSTTGGTNSTTPGGTTNIDAADQYYQYLALLQKGASGAELSQEEITKLLELYNIYGGNGGNGNSSQGLVVPSWSGTVGGTQGLAPTHTYPNVNFDNIQKINEMYDALIASQTAALQEQGDQALSDAQANKDKIAGIYNAQKNAASVDWERQRRNFLESANTSGLNTGAGSQAELAMMSMGQRTQNTLGSQQAAAEAEAERNIADIRRSTQASINEAIAKNDYQKAAALLDEYNNAYNRFMERAEALAQYGDFSGYAAIYGDEAAAQMRQTWIMSNPEIALAMGLITQSQYAMLTLYSQYPALALTGGTIPGGGGDSGGGGGTSTSSTDIANWGNYLADVVIPNIASKYNTTVQEGQ